MENNQDEIKFKWLHGQNSLTFLLVGIIMCLFAFMIHQNYNYVEAKRHKHLVIAEQLKLVEKNNSLIAENNEVKRLKFKESYYAKKNPNLSNCLDAAWKYGQKYPRITPDLIINIQYNESGHNPKAVSNKGAVGVMQVMYPVWYKEFDIDISRMQDVDYNTWLGVEILHIYEKENNGNMIEALKQYNAGGRKHLAGEYPYDTLKSENTVLKLIRVKNEVNSIPL